MRECEVDPGKTITPNANTINTQFLVLRSTAAGDGMIGKGATGGGYIIGNALVERYIPAKRAWRFLTAPYISGTTQTINLSWQEGRTFPTNPVSNEFPGFGTHITGGSESNGFDQGPTSNPSIKTFNGTVWSGTAPLTATTKLTDFPGYMVFVRGDRKTDLTQGALATPTTTVLRSLGTLKTGTQPNVAVSASGYTAIGNPFASTVDFALMTKTNVQNVLYLWDPKRASYGAWVAFDGSLGYTPNSSGGSYTSANSLIQSGQGFLVQSTGTAGTLGIAESNKSSVNRDVFRTATIPQEFIKVNLNYTNLDNSNTVADGLLVVYDNNYSNNVTDEDVTKMSNFEENFSVVNGGKTLSIDKRLPIVASDILYFDLSSTTVRNYQFEVTTQNLNHPNLEGHLVDNYLNIKTPIDLNGTTKVNFAVTTDPLSASSNRFSIEFVKPQIGSPLFTIYPNPIHDGIIKLMMNNMGKGTYNVRILNTAGQTILKKQIIHAEGSSVETIEVNGIKGTFMLEVIKPDHNKIINKIIIN